MAIAIGTQNAEMAKLILEERVEPRDSATFLAQEMLKVHSSQKDFKTKRLQLAIEEALANIEIATSDVLDDSAKSVDFE